MQQAALDIDTPQTASQPTATPQADTCDRTGFELGWDHAHHGLVPPAGLLLEGTPIAQGWGAAKAVFGRRTLPASRLVRQWLQLRTLAWRQGIPFDSAQLTPQFLAQIDTPVCPVTRQPLGGASQGGGAPVTTRLNPQAAYTAGHLAVLSRQAAQALEAPGQNARRALRHASRLEAGLDTAGPLDLCTHQAWRLAVLASFTTALPFAEALRIPLRALPPNRVRVLNNVQGLQVLLTLQFALPGWGARLRAVAALLPEATQRHELQLWAGAMVPRLLEAGQRLDTRATRQALEDAWCDARVNRRWQQLAATLGETGVDRLLAACAQAGMAGLRTQPVTTDTHHLAPQPEAQGPATQDFVLASGGRLPPRGRRPAPLPVATPAPRRPTPGAQASGG